MKNVLALKSEITTGFCTEILFDYSKTAASTGLHYTADDNATKTRAQFRRTPV